MKSRFLLASPLLFCSLPSTAGPAVPTTDPAWVTDVLGYHPPALSCKADLSEAEAFLRLWSLDQLALRQEHAEGVEAEVTEAMASDMYLSDRYSTDVIALSCIRRAVREGLETGSLDRARRVATTKCASQAGLLPDDQRRELAWTLRFLLNAAHLDEAARVTEDEFVSGWPLDQRVADVWLDRFDNATSDRDIPSATRAARGFLRDCGPGTTWWKVNADHPKALPRRSFILALNPRGQQPPAAERAEEVVVKALRTAGDDTGMLQLAADLSAALLATVPDSPRVNTWRGLQGRALMRLGQGEQALEILNAGRTAEASWPGLRPNAAAAALAERAILAKRYGDIEALWDPEQLPRGLFGVKKKLTEDVERYILTIDQLRVGEVSSLAIAEHQGLDIPDEATLHLEVARILLAHRQKVPDRLDAIIRAFPGQRGAIDAARLLASQQADAGQTQDAQQLTALADRWEQSAEHSPSATVQTAQPMAEAAQLDIVQAGVQVDGAGDHPGVLVQIAGSHIEVSGEMLLAWMEWRKARGAGTDQQLIKWLRRTRTRPTAPPSELRPYVTCTAASLLPGGNFSNLDDDTENILLFQDYHIQCGQDCDSLGRRITLPTGDVVFPTDKADGLLMGDLRNTERRLAAMATPVIWPELHEYALTPTTLPESLPQDLVWLDLGTERLGLPGATLADAWQAQATSRGEDQTQAIDALRQGQPVSLYDPVLGWSSEALRWSVGTLLASGQAVLQDAQQRPITDIVIIDWQRTWARANTSTPPTERWFVVPGESPFLLLKEDQR